MSELSRAEVEAAARHRYMWSVLSKDELDSGFPMILADAKGVQVRDVDGNVYVDLTSTVSRASALGYGDERIVNAVRDQLMRLHHAGSGPLQADTVMELASRLADLTPGDLACCAFMVSGSEANEAAIKLAKLYQRENGKPRAYKVIARWDAYHGSVGSAQEISDWLGVRGPVEPGPPGISRIPGPRSRFCSCAEESQCDLRCADFLADHIEHEGPDLVAAFVLEPIAQANGVQIPPPGYLARVREICDAYGVLLVADEVITGFGRTGKWFAVEHWDVQPDIMTLAKAITAGYMPLSAVVVRQGIWDALPAFPDVHTYCGHAGAAAAALAAISVYESDGLVPRVAELGRELLAALGPLGQLDAVRDVRGLGLWAAVEFAVGDGADEIPATGLREIVIASRRRGVLVSQNGRSIELAPPFVISREQLVDGVDRFSASVREICGGS